MSEPAKTATLYRMALPTHLCPSGLKTHALLLREGYQVDDRLLTTRADTDAFKAEHQVQTTPQTFIAGERVGGYDDLRRLFGAPDPKAPTYRPVLAVFAVAGALAVALSWATSRALTPRTLEWFVAFSMCLLALLKLQDVERFSTMFLGYDLLARKWVRYAYMYPWIELGAGLLMVAGVAPWLSAPAAALAGGVGTASVIKAVYLDQRELKCACVGGNVNVPLGFVSLTENLAMLAMAGWTAVAFFTMRAA